MISMLEKHFVELDGFRYPKDATITNFSEKDYFYLYKNLKVFYTENVGEELMELFISCTHMKNKYLIQVIRLRNKVDLLSPMKIQLVKNIMVLVKMLYFSLY